MDLVTTATHRSGRRFEVSTASGHTFPVEGKPDEPAPTAGPGPMELMLVSLATCSGVTLADLLPRMRQPVDALEVRVAGDRAPTPPRVWTEIHVTYRVRGACDDARIRRAVEMAEGKYCSASVMLSRVAKLTGSIEVIRPVEAAETRELRRQILRPHQTTDELVVPGEDHPDAGWFGVVKDGELVGSAGVFPEPSPDAPEAPAWRLRAMAVDESVRGSGLGAWLLAACQDHVDAHGGGRVWASVRVPAAGFYERHGFVAVSEVWEEPEIGPHVRMVRAPR
ncbi:MAG: GNAT family N-acetyltransferase [Acidimicrobiia bacterium]|jgi:uncharacterized OsmC-like protein/GNAT superfamily N-acetyltransferase